MSEEEEDDAVEKYSSANATKVWLLQTTANIITLQKPKPLSFLFFSSYTLTYSHLAAVWAPPCLSDAVFSLKGIWSAAPQLDMKTQTEASPFRRNTNL